MAELVPVQKVTHYNYQVEVNTDKVKKLGHTYPFHYMVTYEGEKVTVKDKKVSFYSLRPLTDAEILAKFGKDEVKLITTT